MLKIINFLFIFSYFLYIISNVTSTYYYFMPSIEAVPPTPPLPSVHAVYYPVRTNCQNQCYPQNRYQWVYRPSES